MDIALVAIIVGGLIMVAVLWGTHGRKRKRATRRTWRGPQ